MEDITKKFILALDQGTTSSRAIVFGHSGSIVSVSQRDFEQLFPKPGWVEHDPQEIWYSQAAVAAEAIAKADITGLDVAAIGITNQRETTIVWDRETSNPVYNAIVWQDRRTAEYCDSLKEEWTDTIRDKTGLIIDAYFSATKIKWILDNVEGARERAEQGKLCFGTVDTWLIWKFSRGKSHVTDVSNASRTMLFNIKDMEWDKELLDLFQIPASMLPTVHSSSERITETASTLFSTKIPIAAIAGDQQAALFGQLCTQKGMAKTTYGTGCFLMMNTGEEPVLSKNNLLSTVAWRIGDKTTYALEGSVFVGGAVIQWLRDTLCIIQSAAETEALATSIDSSEGVYFVPALTGLAAPYWNQYAKGSMFGLTRGSGKAHIVRAALEGIAYQVYDVVKAMENDTNAATTEMRVDGGAVANNFLLQFQADILRSDVVRPKVLETTALGVAYMAGLAVGYWENIESLQEQWTQDRRFAPEKAKEEAEDLISGWHKAIKQTIALTSNT